MATITAKNEVDLGEVTARTLKETVAEGGLNAPELPAAAREALSDYTGAIGAVVAAGRQLEKDRSDLQRRRDLIPAGGYDRLRARAVEDARTKAHEADRAAAKALTRLEDALSAAALPKLSPDREGLARGEAEMALVGATDNPEAAALRLAQGANREPVAALSTPWGRTALEAAGVADAERVHRQLRRLAAGVAIDRGETPTERAAGRALAGLGGIGAARGAAGSYIGHLTKR